MKLIGVTASGSQIVEIEAAENDRLAKAIATIMEMFVPTHGVPHETAAPAPQPQRPAADPPRTDAPAGGAHRSQARPALRANAGVKPTKTCIVCGKPFAPRKSAKTCGPACSAENKKAATLKSHAKAAKPKGVAGIHQVAATECARCHKPRATTPWPAAGRFCKECTAMKARERYVQHAREANAAAAKPATGLRGVIARSYARAKVARPQAPSAHGPVLHGTDRIRAAMARLDAGDGLPKEGGRTLPIIHD